MWKPKPNTIAVTMGLGLVAAAISAGFEIRHAGHVFDPVRWIVIGGTGMYLVQFAVNRWRKST